MPYFDRTRKCSIVFLSLSALFFIMTIITFFNSQFSEILAYNFTNDIRGSILTVIFLMLAIVLLLAGICPMTTNNIPQLIYQGKVTVFAATRT
ncbi:hypothetical protein [Paenibacillus sp. EZ-K15]|uniref:hypothetical protein n=1 Tax=Paenibacillus sp. EZ-K15 TaxID=2044275 RepID=UPI000BF28CE4|nr:hypothetical protein [Paenibacillus sp. EZ-K15]